MLWRVYNVWVTDNHCSDCHEWKHDSHMTSLYGISSQVISKCGAVRWSGSVTLQLLASVWEMEGHNEI